MLDFIIETDKGNIVQSVSKGAVISMLVSIVAVYVIFYVLRSIGIYKLAKGQGIKNAFLAFIPGVWMFIACKIIGKVKIFGYSAEKMASWFAVIFTVAVLVPLVHNFLTYFPYFMYYFEGGNVSIISGSDGLLIECGWDFINQFDTQAVTVIRRILYFLQFIFGIAEIFVTVTVYIALFRKFWPEHYILASVLSFFGLFPIFVFAIRNKKAVDFNEFIRQRYYGSGFTPYGNRYYGNGQNNGGRGPYYGNGQNGENEPFDEFSNRPEEPFGEFDGGTKNRGENDNDNNSGNNGNDYYQ